MSGGYYSNVTPRYLDPRKPPPQLSLPPREKIPVNPQYVSVAPRYLSPRRTEGAASGGGAAADANKKKGGHQSISKDILFQKPKNPKLSHVQARFLDPANYAPQSNSPRRVVEQKHFVDRRELGWRTDLVSGSCKIFDDYRPYTAAREASQPKPKRNFKNAPSCVAAYVNDNIPIKHSSMVPTPEGGNHSRPVSPFRSSRTGSPTRWWSNSGWQGTTFSTRERQTVLCQPQYLKEVKHVKEQVEKCSSAKVSPNHVPRVATLAPGFRLQEMLKMDRESSHQRAEASLPLASSHQGSPSRPVSPQRTRGGDSPTPFEPMGRLGNHTASEETE